MERDAKEVVAVDDGVRLAALRELIRLGLGRRDAVSRDLVLGETDRVIAERLRQNVPTEGICAETGLDQGEVMATYRRLLW